MSKLSKKELKSFSKEVIKSFLRSIFLKRHLHKKEKDPKSNFWKIIYGNCLDVAAIDFCKIFGSKSESLNWKKIVPENDHAQFKIDLLNKLKINVDEWNIYTGNLKKYRNKYAAHFDAGNHQKNGGTYPEFTLAIQAMEFYYSYLFSESLKPDLFEKELSEISKDIKII